MKNLSISILIILGIALVSSCKNSSTNDVETSEIETQLVEFNSMFGTRSNLQSVSEVMIKSGILYDADLTLDTLIKPEYTDTQELAAVYCGIYSADAIYHSVFQNSDASFESYTSAQVLANYLGIGPYYVENLLKRDKDGLTEADSLLFKFNDVLAKFDTSLSEETRFRIIASYLIGNIIEKLYLIDKGVATLENKPITEITKQAQFLFQLLISEEKTIDVFVDILNKYAKNPGNPLHVEMITLQSLYKELSNKGIPDYKPGDTYVPTEEMKNISVQIENTRNIILGE